MKIDKSKIKDYDKLTPEQKIAALESYEYDDGQAEIERLKGAITKSNADAADWKRKHHELLTEDQRKAEEAKDAQAQHDAELESLKNTVAELQKKEKTSKYTAEFIGQGYDAQLAAETAQALTDGKMDVVFANGLKFADSLKKQTKADLLNSRKPTPGQVTNKTEEYTKAFEAASNALDYVEMSRLIRTQEDSTHAEME